MMANINYMLQNITDITNCKHSSLDYLQLVYTPITPNLLFILGTGEEIQYNAISRLRIRIYATL